MKFRPTTTNAGLVASAAAHAGLLLWGLLTFSSKALDAAPSDSMPVDIISVSEFSKMRAGEQNAPKAEAPKPLVEKVGERKPVDTQIAKVVDKPEIATASAKPTAPEEKKEPEKKEAEKKKEPEPKKDPIAEALKKDETKKPEPKKVEPKPAPKKQPSFDPKQIEKKLALLDKRTMQRQAALGDTISGTPALGTPTGSSAQLSMSELDAFKRKLLGCWSPPPGTPNNQLKVLITIRLKQNGALDGLPALESVHRETYARARAESAVRAIIQCAPYTMFSQTKYDTWKEIPLSFNPDEFFN